MLKDETITNFSCKTDIGKKRKNNEDTAQGVKGPYSTLLVVCDGMGGHRKGEVASSLIRDSLIINFQKNRKKFNLRRVKHFFRKYLKVANKEIYKMSMDGTDVKEMGSTVVASMIYDGGTYIVSAGDSRCYTYSKEDGLIQRTTDQTYVQVLFEEGKITKAEMAQHPQKNLLVNAVGILPELTHLQEFYLPNDTYETLLLCSDGLYNMVSENEIVSILQNGLLTVEQKAQALIDKALENGGNDNIAVALWENM